MLGSHRPAPPGPDDHRETAALAPGTNREWLPQAPDQRQRANMPTNHRLPLRVHLGRMADRFRVGVQPPRGDVGIDADEARPGTLQTPPKVIVDRIAELLVESADALPGLTANEARDLRNNGAPGQCPGREVGYAIAPDCPV